MALSSAMNAMKFLARLHLAVHWVILATKDVACTSGAGGACEDDPDTVVLLQHKLHTPGTTKQAGLTAHNGDERSKPNEVDNDGAWMAGAFADCCRVSTASAEGLRLRDVTCRDVFTREAVAGCPAEAKPATTRKCSCTEMPCQESCLGDVEPDSNAQPVSYEQYALLGCLPTDAEATSRLGEELDWGCLEAEGGCRDGLPFYRKAVGGDVALCFTLCIGHALDVFAVVRGGPNDGECRCGASKANTAIWSHAHGTEKAFVLPTGLSRAACASTGVEAYRYTGYLDAGGIPPYMITDRLQDTLYVDSIVAGRVVGDEIEDGFLDEASKIEDPLDVDGIAMDGPSWERQCYPSCCSMCYRLWTKTEGDVNIPFIFHSEVDIVRRNAFREAARRWRASTCINFVEQASTPTEDFVAVVVENLRSCYVAFRGREVRVNLGWCNSNRYIGVMMHELGHVVGMGHEMLRPDSDAGYNGKGPHLVIHWENIPNSWKPQYTPNERAYTGSNYQGRGDAAWGYQQYNWLSLMHYRSGNVHGLGINFDTIPSEMAELTGQRQGLSLADVTQVSDMYQCPEPFLPAGLHSQR